MRFSVGLGALLILLPATWCVAAETRIALIIGNSDYANANLKLTNPANDAAAMQRALKAAGFETIVTLNAKRLDFYRAVDEFSAVSRRLPIWQLYERARSLGLAVQVSAQSWPGLAADEDERYRVATTADGGIWLLRTPHPEPVAALAGARR